MRKKAVYEEKTPKEFQTKEFKELKDKWNKILDMPEEPHRLNKEFVIKNRKSDEDEDEPIGVERFSNEDMQKWPKGINSKYEELQHFWKYDNKIDEKIMFLYITYHMMYKRIAAEVGVSLNRVKNVVRRTIRQMKKVAS